MINYWWVTRPKRKLNSVPEVLASISTIALQNEWQGQKDTQLSVEDALEDAGLKRVGERRDQGGSGARTYIAWLKSLGLLFTAQNSKKLELTLAGEAVLQNDFPFETIKNQVLKYQFPSNFSLSRNIDVSPRFKVHPFIFLLKLLTNQAIQYLTVEEIALIVILHGENETASCYEKVINRILDYRAHEEFYMTTEDWTLYPPSKGNGRPDDPTGHLLDIGNTIINWLEYTQLAKRDEDKKVRILEDKKDEVNTILAKPIPFIDRPENEEVYQRKYGLDTKHSKDTRNLANTKTITSKIIDEQKIKSAFISLSLSSPITAITQDIIETIKQNTGIDKSKIEDYLLKTYPHGAIGSFMSEYFEMAFKGREDATEFEKNTVLLFQEIFHYNAKHVGPIGLTPDVLIVSDSDGYQAIIDNKAYSKYTISNDHRNRMIHNYIYGINNYSESKTPLAFFTYIAGGFGSTIDSQLKSISDESSVNGSAITVARFIDLIKNHQNEEYSHSELRKIFSLNREIRNGDFLRYNYSDNSLLAAQSAPKYGKSEK